ILFLLYTADVLDIVSVHGLNAHVYADDTQLYFHSLPDQLSLSIPKMIACVDDINDWMASNRLRLNTDKTEFIWFASSHHLQNIQPGLPLSTRSASITPSPSVRDLGVYFDSVLNLNE